MRTTLAGSGRGRHESFRLLQVLDAGSLLGKDALGNGERLAIATVEALRDIAGQLEMLALVVSDGTMSVW